MTRLLTVAVVMLLALVLPMNGSYAQETAAGAFDVEQASRAYIDTLKGEDLEKSNSYFEGGYWLTLWGAVVGFLIDFFLLKSRLTSHFRQWAERKSKRNWAVTWLTAMPYLVASFVLSLPWSIYTGFVREKQYDLVSQGFGAWAGEQLIGFAISLLIFPLLIIAIFAVIRRAPKIWWLWGTGIVAIFLFVGLLLAPVFISPLFNEYTEMEEGPLRDRIVAMAEAHDVPSENIYVFNQSKQHKRISANVSGVGPTIRISLNDNLLERTDPEEVAAVMGHELGHYVLGHTWRTILIIGLIIAVGLFLISRFAPKLIDRHGEKWGVRSVSDPAALPLFGMLLTVYFLAATPALNTLIRVNESDADLFGLNAAKEPDGFAKVAMRLSEYRKIEPGPIEEMLFFDHPSGATRVRMAMQWKADNVENPVMVEPGALEADTE